MLQVDSAHTLQLALHEPSPQRDEPTGHVTCVGHTELDATHSPPLQRKGEVAGQAGTVVHCVLERTHEPLAHCTGVAAGQAERVGQSISWLRHDPSGQRIGAATGQVDCTAHLDTLVVHVMPSAHSVGADAGHAVVDGQRAVRLPTRSVLDLYVARSVALGAEHEPSPQTTDWAGHTRGLTQ